MSSPTTVPFEVPISRAQDDGVSAIHDEVLGLFDAYSPRLRRYVRSCGVSPEAADDVVQETFIALFRHLRAAGSRRNLYGWLIQVSYRLALKQRKRVARQQRREKPWQAHLTDVVADPAWGQEERLAAAQDQRRVTAVYQALPERDRQCLVLRAEGLRYRDIARTLRISLGAVAKSLARAVARMSNAIR